MIFYRPRAHATVKKSLLLYDIRFLPAWLSQSVIFAKISVDGAHARERKERGNVKVRIKGYAKRLTCAISFVIHAISASVEEKRCNARRYLTQ